MEKKQHSKNFVQQFNQLYLKQLQERQESVKANEVGALFDRYQEKNAAATSKDQKKKVVEQILLALPLWLITLTPPDGMTALEYVKCITDIDEELQIISERVKSSFDLH